jgi:serine/threonine-protein phosphatase 2A activator
VDKTPPSAHTLRYGNPAYRVWSSRVSGAAAKLLSSVVERGPNPAESAAAVPELVPYFQDSFGNATRIDYGTGHETTFVSLLYCLAKLGVVGASDTQALVTRVFAKYLALMRKVQTTYWCGRGEEARGY